ncbi:MULTISPECIES: hypothetical protein [Staphylococcus]|nr:MULTISPECIES: hypothetical protein [Staphylococcus]MBF0737415.1 hypothetical protein [Staphylococcus arlettae]MDU0462079.1 hypothetical protein [Staphylococcus ureilyticus]
MKYLIYISMLSILTVLIGIALDIFIAFALYIVASAVGIKFTNLEEV